MPHQSQNDLPIKPGDTKLKLDGSDDIGNIPDVEGKLSETKVDLKKLYKTYYSASSTPEIVKFAATQYISVLGQGETAGTRFLEATEALCTVAYNIKAIAKAVGDDFGVPNLEGLWWVDDSNDALDIDRQLWHWKLLIRLPDQITLRLFQQGQINALKKKPNLRDIERVCLDHLPEVQAVQMLHVGPYSIEPETLKTMRRFMKDRNLKQSGLHHEVYLSDPRKTKPKSLKTILRLPVSST